MNYSWNQFRIISWFFIIFPLHFLLFCSIKFDFLLLSQQNLCFLFPEHPESTFAVKCNKHQGQDQTNVWVVASVTWTQDRVTFHLRLHPYITPTSPRWWHSGKQIFTTDVPLTHIHTFIIQPLTLLFTHTWSTQILSFKQSKTRKYNSFWMSEVNRKQIKLNVKDIQSKNTKFKIHISHKEKI